MSAVDLHTHPAAQKIAVFDVDSVSLFLPGHTVQEKVAREYYQNSSVYIAGLDLMLQWYQMVYLLGGAILFRCQRTFRAERTI